MSKLPTREHSRATYQSLRAATRKTNSVLGLEASADICGCGKTTLGRYQEAGDHFIPIDKVADLEAREGADFPHIIDRLAQLAGYVLVPTPKVDNADPYAMGALAQATKEFGDVASVISQALAGDGKISVDEIKQLDIEKELRQAQQALAVLNQLITDIKEEGEG